MNNTDLAFAPAWQVRDMIASKELSPMELTDLFLDRIDSLDPRLNSYLTVTADLARESAAAAEEAVTRGDDLGPLHGVPISIKDLEFSKGIRSTMGCYVFRDHVPDEDSVVVDRVRRAGAIILGKTNTPEFGQLGTTENLLGDACRNPWNTERTSGGSSGGAGSALIAGLCSLATGSDGGGSIRIPASFCGVYGIKPTQLRVPRYGSVGRGPATANLFSQSGPMSRNVKRLGPSAPGPLGPRPPGPHVPQGPRPRLHVGPQRRRQGPQNRLDPDYGYAPVDPDVLRISEAAARNFEALGASVEEVDVGLSNTFRAFWTMFSTAAYSSYGHLLNHQAADLTTYGRYSLEQGRAATGAAVAQALHVVTMVKRRFEELLDEYDLLMSPTMPTVAFPVGQPPKEVDGKGMPPHLGYIPFTFPINMSGQTAASIPCGFSDGMPVGLHVIGKTGDEATVLRASAAYEQAHPWADARPPVS